MLLIRAKFTGGWFLIWEINEPSQIPVGNASENRISNSARNFFANYFSLRNCIFLRQVLTLTIFSLQIAVGFVFFWAEDAASGGNEKLSGADAEKHLKGVDLHEICDPHSCEAKDRHDEKAQNCVSCECNFDFAKLSCIFFWLKTQIKWFTR